MIPDSLKPYFWSYDTKYLDLKKHKKLIISQLLNFGSKQATDWLFSTYSKDEIKQTAAEIPSDQWDKKSLRFWSLILNIHPHNRSIEITQAA